MAITKYQTTRNPVLISGGSHGSVYKISDKAVAKVPLKSNLSEDITAYEFEMARALMRRGINVAKPLDVGTVMLGKEGKSLAYIMEFVDGEGFYDLPLFDERRALVAKKYREEVEKAIDAGFGLGYEKITNYTNFIIDKQDQVKLIDFVTWIHPKVERPCTMEVF